MRIEHEGLSLSFAPPASLVAGAPYDIELFLEPASPGARVELQWRTDDGGGREEAQHFKRSDQDGSWYVVRLPAFAGGSRVKVTVRAALRDRRRVPAEADDDAASFDIDIIEGAAPGIDDAPTRGSLDALLPEPDSVGARRAAGKLERRGIATVADLLAEGETALADLPSRDRRVVRKFAAHAALAVTVSDPLDRSALLERGFSSPAAIAAMPRLEFRNSTADVLTTERADEFHRAASVQTAFLNGLAIAETSSTSSALTAAVETRTCGCEDCEAATSPLAYLADLIAYVRASVQVDKDGGGTTPLALDGLSELLQQPLGDLIASCGAATDPVREVRLLIETLRRHLAAVLPTDADVICSPFPVPLESVVAGDVDGDRRDELVVCFSKSASSWLALPNNVHSGYFVMDFDPVTGSWTHLQPMADAVGADFLLGPGVIAKKTVCADLDGDGRDEVVIAIGNRDGSPHPQLGRTWFWVMDYDPAQHRWGHLNPATFAQAGADLWLDDSSVSFVDLVAGDVDGDSEDELIISVTSSAKPNAYWVFDYVLLLSGARAWAALSPALDASLPAFEFEQPTAGYASYRPRLTVAWDVDNNGRDEVVAFPDAPGGLGASAWIMSYDPPVPATPGTVGAWHHLSTNLGALNTDLPATWGWPARPAQFFGGSTRGLNSSALLLAAESVGAGAAATDPNSFFEVQYDSTVTPDPWDPPDQIDCATDTRAVSAAFAADIDGDLTDEIVAVIDSRGRRAAWVMDRQTNGQWQHISPIAGHALGADLEWCSGDDVFRGALAADIDLRIGGTLHKELVFYGTTVNSIWVMRFDDAAKTWHHVSPVVRTDVESDYLLAAYQALLAEIGTSLEELRTARGADDDARVALAQRLGIVLRPDQSKPDTLTRLLLAPNELNEAVLEELFGLVDTTRDGLSQGQVRNDGRGQIKRFEFDGVAWSSNPWVANVGREGDLRLALAKLPSQKIEVDISRPDGILVASGTGDATGRLRLTEAGQTRLSGLVALNYVQDTSSVELGVIPRVTAWRLDRLREIWDDQDRPTSPFEVSSAPDEPVLPAIDPDVVGPDDFRTPLEKAAAADPDAAFDLWVARRTLVDQRLRQLEQLQPDLDAMLASLRPPAGAAANDPDYAWGGGAPSATTFRRIADEITRGDDSTAAAARSTVRTKLWLPPDAFLRLVELARHRAESGQLSQGEWDEVRSILILALKRRRYELWRQEEQTAGITVDSRSFWRSARAPLEGVWPPRLNPNEPLVDPEAIALVDLPNGAAGAAARGLWRDRSRQLADLSTRIRAQQTSGLEAMFVAALGAAPTGATWRALVGTLAADLESTDPTVVATAQTEISTRFGIAPGPFRRIAGLAAKVAASQEPTDAEWLDFEAVLTSSHKQLVEYTAWTAEEQALGALLPYWRARRALSPRWRASPEHRLAWEAEFRERSRSPVVDPDRFPATQLRTRALNEPTATLYSVRRSWLAAQTQALAALRVPTSSVLQQFDDVLCGAFFPSDESSRLTAEIRRRRQARGLAPLLEETFAATAADASSLASDLGSSTTAIAARARGRVAREFWLDGATFSTLATIIAKTPATITAAEWATLEQTLARATLVSRIAGAQADATRIGVRVRVLLEQLGLRAPAHAQLLRMREVAIAGGPILDAEWDDVIEIALRAEKERRFGEWLRDELGTSPDRRVRLGPDSFVLPNPDNDPFDPSAWLVTREEVRDWGSTLRSRTEQHENVELGMRDVVSRVEELTLPILRDALLPAVAPSNSDAAGWVSDHFLADARNGGCGLTTRAAHAINTTLALLWSLRTGLLRDTYPQLRLFGTSFDADWPFIGSYSGFRSVALVRLYPQNLYRPNLRRHKSPVFAEILDELRSGRDLTPTRARELARRYSNYLRDVATLDLGDVACAHVDWARKEGGPVREHEFVFAASDASGKLYWTTIDVNAPPIDRDYAQAFWAEVPGLGGNDVVGLVGATAYQPTSPNPFGAVPSWVYVFALTQDLDGTGVVFVRFNLTTRQWEDRVDLEAPKERFTARLLAHGLATPPRLRFDVTTQDDLGQDVQFSYTAAMNKKGVGWNSDGLKKDVPGPWVSRNVQLSRTPRQLLTIDPYGPSGAGVVELVGVPATADPIEFHRFTVAGMAPRGNTSRSIELGTMVCVGDLDGDRREEIGWTLEAGTPPALRRTTAVLIEKKNLANNLWQPHSPNAALANGASATALAPADPAALAKFMVCGDIDGVNGAELLLAIQEFRAFYLSTETYIDTGSWNGFWGIWRFGTGYRRTSPYTYVPDPDMRTQYERDDLGAAFTCGGGESASAFAVVGNFDGDALDELVVFVAPKINPAGGNDYARGNAFWALDRRSDGKLRPLGTVSTDGLRTVGDFSPDATVVADAIAADVDGDGRDELIAIPWTSDTFRGADVWVADFRPGGAPDPADGGSWALLPPIPLANEQTPVTGAIGVDLDGDGTDEVVLFGIGKTWVRKYDVAGGTWVALPDLVLPANATVAAAAAGRFLPGTSEQLVVSLGTVVAEETVLPNSYNRAGDQEVRRRYKRTPSGRDITLFSYSNPVAETPLSPCAPLARKPLLTIPNEWQLDDTVSVSQLRALTKTVWQSNATMPASITTYIWEAFYGLRVAIALQHQRARNYTAALDWFRLVYDYTAPIDERKTYYGLVAEESIADTGFSQSLLAWLRDPLDVHAIAGTRPHTVTRATLILIIRCLLDDGHSEFTIDTPEAIERARLIFETVLELLRLPILNEAYAGCSDVIGRILAGSNEPEAGPVLSYISTRLGRELPRGALVATLEAVVDAMSGSQSLEKRTERATEIADRALAAAPLPATIADVLGATSLDEVHNELLRMPAVAAVTADVGRAYGELSRAESEGSDVLVRRVTAVPRSTGYPVLESSSSPLIATTTGEGDGTPLWGFSTGTGVWFCVGPNPLLKALRLDAELNLQKIRTCRNIAGMRRALDFYSGATDQTTGLPMIGVNGELVLPGARTAPPTPYRYSALIERAKDLARTAQQLEALLLAALERRDAEAYTLLQARQHTQTARETVRLNELQVRQAESRVARAELQRQRAEIEQDHYLELLEAGTSDLELEALTLLQEAIEYQRTAAALSVVSAIASAAAAASYTVAAGLQWSKPEEAASLLGSAFGAVASGVSTMSGFAQTEAAIASTQSQAAAMRAGQQRTRQEWELRQRLATQDIVIADQEMRIEEDSVRIAEQQRTISELDLDQAEQLLDFLNTKFTSVELYEWMIPILERAYARVLQPSAATGRMAAAQLAFERQGEVPPQPAADYWQPPAEEGIGGGAVTDRRGLTGAERLMQDLVELDQFAFETNRRKLQLSKTISLSQLAPLELERLRTTGVATFVTSSELFDRDFPGHHLRLIKRVAVSLVALVPPVEGIRATLTSSGISRVVVGPEVFQQIIVRREPQTIALTSPVNATGLFAFEAQPDLANPCELDGVDMGWEFRLPIPSNPFDYRSIADLLVTIDYTALDSYDYRQQVIRQIGRDFVGDRVFSLRNDFPDAWWDLHNPDQTSTPLSVMFDTSAADFPPTLDDVTIEQVALVASARGDSPRGLTVRLRFAESPGDAGPTTSTPWLVAAPVDGIASTRRGNAGAWFALLGKRPAGRWWLSLPDTEEIREWLEDDALLDLQLVLSFRGETPPWPS